MTAPSDWLMIAVWSVGLGVVGAALAGLLRGAAVPGGRPSSAVLGGLLAGLLLGSTVAGRIAPDLSHRTFQGGGTESVEIEELARRHATEIAALEQIDATPVAIDEQRESQARELAPLLEARDSAQMAQHRRWAILFGVVASAWLLLGAAGAAKRSRAKESALPGIAAGVGSVVFAAAPAFLLIRWMTQASVVTAVAFSCAVAIGGAHFDARTRWSERPGRRRGVDVAALSALALTTAIVTAVVPAPLNRWLGVAVVVAVAVRFLRPLSRGMRRVMRGVSTDALLPAIVAIGAAHVDFIAVATTSLFWIALIIAAIFCADGRWLGGWVGWWSLGRDHQWRSAWTRSSSALTAGVGGMQMAMAGGALLAGVLPPAIAAGLMLSAPMLELATPMRRRISIGLDTGAVLEAPDQRE